MATPSGPVAIASLQTGDGVWAVDGAGARVPARVTRRLEGWTDWLVEIRTSRETLLATRSHRFHADGAWCPARLLHPGALLAVPGAAAVPVEAVRLLPCVIRTCNLEVAPHHNFLVGAAGLLVHNGDADEPPRDFGSTREHLGEIYHISIRENGVWRLVYVGSTNKEGLSLARFREHIGQGREGNVNFPRRQAGMGAALRCRRRPRREQHRRRQGGP